MKLIIDQIHANSVLCDTFSGSELILEINAVDKTANEGDVIYYNSGKWLLDSESTIIRSRYVKKLISQVFED